MKKIYILLLAVLLVGSVSAQGLLQLGVLAGANISRINSSDPADNVNNITAWQAGIMAEIKFAMIGVELDAIYMQNGAKLDIFGTDIDLKNTYIALPLVAKLYLLKILNIHAGPQFSFLTSSKLDDIDFKDQLESTDLQVVLGAGVEVSRFYSSIRYTIGVSDINADADSDTELTNSSFMVTVGYWLKK